MNLETFSVMYKSGQYGFGLHTYKLYQTNKNYSLCTAIIKQILIWMNRLQWL